MNAKQWLAFGAAVCVPMLVAAQARPTAPDPLYANASVPALQYESAFVGYQSFAREQSGTPDKSWRVSSTPQGQSSALVDAHAGHGAAPAVQAVVPKQVAAPERVSHPAPGKTQTAPAPSKGHDPQQGATR
jgi:hypothetical protein